jgi:hypothetical protein
MVVPVQAEVHFIFKVKSPREEKRRNTINQQATMMVDTSLKPYHLVHQPKISNQEP